VTSYEFKFSDIFPVDDPVARWLVTLSMGFNDILLANLKVESARTEYERLTFFRLAALHLWETAKFVGDTYESIEEVRTFTDGLPEAARQRREKVNSLRDTGALAVGQRLVQIRDLLAHYPEMKSEAKKLRDPVSKAMTMLAESDTRIDLADGRQLRDLRLSYADDVVAAATLDLMPSEDAQRKVLGSLAEQVGEITAFVQLALDAWLEPRAAKLTRSDTDPV
jgi:hypothetical protein